MHRYAEAYLNEQQIEIIFGNHCMAIIYQINGNQMIESDILRIRKIVFLH